MPHSAYTELRQILRQMFCTGTAEHDWSTAKKLLQAPLYYHVYNDIQDPN